MFSIADKARSHMEELREGPCSRTSRYPLHCLGLCKSLRGRLAALTRDLTFQFVQFDEIAGLAAHFVRHHGRRSADGGDHVVAAAAPLQSLLNTWHIARAGTD